MTKGSGDARMQPLYFLITTAGLDVLFVVFLVQFPFVRSVTRKVAGSTAVGLGRLAGNGKVAD